MLYSGFNILLRSVVRSAYSIDRSDNLDVIQLHEESSKVNDEKMSRQYIQTLAEKLLTKYQHEILQFPGYRPYERLLEAADALNRMANRQESTSPMILDSLTQAKDHGTAGYEMWVAGQVWVQHYCD